MSSNRHTTLDSSIAATLIRAQTLDRTTPTGNASRPLGTSLVGSARTANTANGGTDTPYSAVAIGRTAAVPSHSFIMHSVEAALFPSGHGGHIGFQDGEKPPGSDLDDPQPPEEILPCRWSQGIDFDGSVQIPSSNLAFSTEFVVPSKREGTSWILDMRQLYVRMLRAEGRIYRFRESNTARSMASRPELPDGFVRDSIAAKMRDAGLDSNRQCDEPCTLVERSSHAKTYRLLSAVYREAMSSRKGSADEGSAGSEIFVWELWVDSVWELSWKGRVDQECA